ncbi:ParB/RepB/Spo0J family partition protein [Candidatus Saccharibacteria bacterium]|nr:ParB/RepB/Spo0J family partition protein [Candidatus Saccharibacteria bacterium]MCA9328744.1 ParB/RepB/Spo0J family partition protein [Candidatus Saccharibacteria bacterium]
MTKTVLGRGFEGLIPTGFDVSQVAEPGEQVRQLSIEKIVANPDQPRREFDEQGLKDLAESIKMHGVIQPLVVTPTGDLYRIVAGERRFRASKIAGLKKVPAIVRNHKELEELEIALVENVQRVDLSPLEQALSIVRLRDQFSLSPKDIAKKLGKAETTISNIIRLLQLPEKAVEALRTNRITEGHARAILSLKFSNSLQSELLKKIEEDGLSVRESEEWVKQQKVLNEQKSSSISMVSRNLVQGVNNRGYSAKVQERKRGGVLIFDFKTEEELQKILKKL